jgi:hypothetical protein
MWRMRMVEPRITGLYHFDCLFFPDLSADRNTTRSVRARSSAINAPYKSRQEVNRDAPLHDT